METRSLRGDNLEARLERIEKMMEHLMKRELEAKDREEEVVRRYRALPGGKLSEAWNAPFDNEKLRGEVERSMQEIERHRSFFDEEGSRAKQRQKEAMGAMGMSMSAEKEALREQQRMLQKQMQALQQRLDALEEKEKGAKSETRDQVKKEKGTFKYREKGNPEGSNEAPPSADIFSEPRKF